jgi:hypothetical protein
MRRPYCCDASRGMYEEYYTRQQKGEGMPVYMGAASQRGHGLGNIIGSLFRRILPFLQRGAAVALRTGATVIDDVRGGKTVKDSLKSRVPDGIKTFATKLFDQSGSGVYKRNKSLKRKKTDRQCAKRRHPASKRRRGDLFGQ